jgi:hypothetical protein
MIDAEVALHRRTHPTWCQLPKISFFSECPKEAQHFKFNEHLTFVYELSSGPNTSWHPMMPADVCGRMVLSWLSINVGWMQTSTTILLHWQLQQRHHLLEDGVRIKSPGEGDLPLPLWGMKLLISARSQQQTSTLSTAPLFRLAESHRTRPQPIAGNCSHSSNSMICWYRFFHCLLRGQTQPQLLLHVRMAHRLHATGFLGHNRLHLFNCCDPIVPNMSNYLIEHYKVESREYWWVLRDNFSENVHIGYVPDTTASLRVYLDLVEAVFIAYNQPPAY